MKNKYSLSKKVLLFYWLIKTKLICSQARLIRFPIDIRGRKYIDFGKKLTTGVGCRLEAFSSNTLKTLHFGDNVQLNDYVHITAMKHVAIGNNVLMAGKIYISDCVHGYYNKDDEENSFPDVPPVQRAYQVKGVVVGDNVWLGEGVCVLPGVTIGRGAVIGANAVVNKDIPAYCIAVGVPAKVVKKFNFETNKWERV